MGHTSIPDLEPELRGEWERVAETLQKLGLSKDGSYPALDSARRDPKSSLAAAIDHTLLKQSAQEDEYRELCRQAREWQTFSVCIPPNICGLAASELEGSGVKVCTVISFPFGYCSSSTKAAETRQAIMDGAEEVDMVQALGLLKDDKLEALFEDISSVVEAAQGRLVKVILETSELSPIEIVRSSALACFAGASFLKTSSGFASGGASLEALSIMRRVAGDLRGVKASGGVRTREFALQCLNLGVDRIGASSTAAILGYGDAQTNY